MSFKDLDIRSKAEIIRVGVRNGMARIPEIEKAYNEFANGGHLFEGTAEPNQQMTSWLPSFATNPQEQNVSPKFQQLVNEMVQVGQQRAYQRAEGKKIEALAHNTNEMLPIQLASQGKLDEARIAGQNLGLQTMGNVADVATDFMPVIGDAKDVIRICTDIAKGDYTNAALTAVLMALPVSASAIKRILPRNFSTKLAYKALKNSNDFNAVTPEKRIELLLGNYLDEKRMARRNSVTESLKAFAESNTLAGESKEMYDMLVSNGVDVSKLKSVDLAYLRRIRQQQLAKQMPTRYINDNTYDPLNQIMTLYEPGNTSAIGKLEYASVNSQHKGFNWKYGIQPTMIENLTEGTDNIRKGVSVDLYDAAIAKSKNLGYDGVISGALLLSPEATTHIWEKYYPTRELLSNRGVHKYKAGDPHNQPIVMLNTPSREVLPTKSFVFNPSIIDDSGFMHIQPNGGIYFSTGGPMYPFSFGQLPEVRY